MDELESLVEKGLVRVLGEGERYALLETIRAFAAEQLHAGGEVDATRDAHAIFFLEFARTVDAGIQSDGQVDAMQRGRAENANTFAALDWLLARARSGTPDAAERGLLLCGYLGWYWHIAGLHMVARDTVDALLGLVAGGAPTRGRALAQFTGGMVSANTGEMDRAIAEWTDMLDDGRAVGDTAIVTFAQCGLGYLELGLGRLDESRVHLEDAIADAERGGHHFFNALSRTINRMRMFVSGDLDGGIAMVESARRIQIRNSDFESGGMALSFLASMTFARATCRPRSSFTARRRRRSR